jgi:L-alanine-DL-glutamate epimerase-like enolase superfamily enzyme
MYVTAYFVNFEACGQEVATTPFQVDNGYIALPTTPGLGIGLGQEGLQRYPYREFPLRGLPTFHDERP